MQLVRQIQLKPTPLLDDLCIRSKNLFNVATFTVRQHLLEEKTWIRYYDLWKLLKSHKAYKKLAELAGSHPPQQVKASRTQFQRLF